MTPSREPPPPPAANRRSGRRMTPRAGIMVTCRPNAMNVGPNHTLAVMDLSDTGAKLRLRGPLRPGQAAVLTLEGTYNGKSVVREARVRWCGLATDGTAVAGFVFDKPVPYSELTHFVRM